MTFPYIPLAYALTEFAPLISRWIGGPEKEAQAQKLVEVAQNVTGLTEGSSILKALRKDPQLITQFQKSVMEIENQLEQATLQDRQYARLRDIALAEAGHSNLRADIMVVAAAVGLVSCLATITLFKQNLPGEAIGIISTVAGIFGSCLKDAYAFEFGSSRGSKQKDTKIGELLG